MECLGEDEKPSPGIVCSDSAHLAEIVDIQDVAGNMPPEVPWLAISDSVANL